MIDKFRINYLLLMTAIGHLQVAGTLNLMRTPRELDIELHGWRDRMGIPNMDEEKSRTEMERHNLSIYLIFNILGPFNS